MCFDDGSSIQLKSFNAIIDGRPTLEPLANGYTLKSAYKTSKNSIICKFTRTVNVPSGSENLMHDASTSLHMLYAHGDYKTGIINYHGGTDDKRFITKDKMNLVPLSVSKTVHLLIGSLLYNFILTRPESCLAIINNH